MPARGVRRCRRARRARRSNDESLARNGWPNALDDDGRAVPPSAPAGLFNSPHGVTVGRNGAVYVTEWSLGGRWIRVG